MLKICAEQDCFKKQLITEVLMVIKKSKASNLPKRTGFMVGLIMTVVIISLLIQEIQNSLSSTAAIGYVFLPVTAIFVFLFFGFLGYCLGVVIEKWNERKTLGFYLSFCVVILAGVYFGTGGIELAMTKHTLNKIKDMNSTQIEQAFYDRPKFSIHGYDVFVIAAIARDLSTSAKVLDQIAHLKDPRFDERLGSLFNLNGANKRGFAINRLIVMNENVAPETLVYLSDSNNFYVLGDIAMNKKTPREILLKLYERSKHNSQGYMIEWGLKSNPNTPGEVRESMRVK